MSVTDKSLEVFNPIFDFQDDSCTIPRCTTFSFIYPFFRTVSKDWNQALDTIIKVQWDANAAHFYKEGRIDLWLLMNALKSENPTLTGNQLLSELRKKIESIYFTNLSRCEKLSEIPELLSSYHQGLVDKDIQKLWGALLPNLTAFGAFSSQKQPDTVRGVRAFLNDPENAVYLDQIKTINLSGRGLNTCPQEIGLLTGLISLNLSSNSLSHFSLDLSKCTQLRELHLKNNYLQIFSSDLSALTCLETLILSDNRLTEFSVDLTHNTELKILDIHSNKLRDFSPVLRKCFQLKELSINHNPLKNFSGDIILNCINLSILALWVTKLTEFSMDLSRFSKLELLGLQGNALEEFSCDVSKCTKLVTIALESNKLTKFTTDLSKNTQLKNVYLNNNLLVTLPLKDILPNWEDSGAASILVDNNPILFSLLSPEYSRAGNVSSVCYKPCIEHNCTSSLAMLCQAVINNADLDTVKELHSKLKVQDQARIANALLDVRTGLWEDVFEDPISFDQALFKMVKTKCEGYIDLHSEELLEKINSMDTSRTWGVGTIGLNVLLVIDAIAKIELI